MVEPTGLTEPWMQPTKEREESRMTAGFWPSIPFNEMGKASWEKIWGEKSQ